MKDTNGSVEQKNKDIIHKSETKAKAEADLVQAKNDSEAVLLELEQLGNYKAELHGSCDFVVKNFAIRQAARDEEVEADGQAGPRRAELPNLGEFTLRLHLTQTHRADPAHGGAVWDLDQAASGTLRLAPVAAVPTKSGLRDSADE